MAGQKKVLYFENKHCFGSTKYQNNLLTASKWQGFELFYKGNRRAYHKLQAYKKNRMNLWRLLKKFSMVTEGHCTFLDSLG